MKKGKKEITMNGSLLRPLVVGRSAIIYANGKRHHTSPVLAIQEYTEYSIRFETASARYHLCLQSFPYAAISPLPVSLAAA